MKYVALYARVSTAEQASEGYSIGEQIERLKAFCQAMNWNSFRIHVDAGFSGSNIERPALKELISDIEKGIVEKVVVFKLDRLSRSQKDTLNLIEDVFLKNGVDFVSISENFDTATPFGRAMVGILAVFAQLEREQIRERMSIGREARAKEGFYHGGDKYPVGYNYIDGMLVVDEVERMQVLEIFDRYLKGESLTTIDKEFKKKGFCHKYGEYTRKQIRKVLTSPLYCGNVCFAGKWYKGNHEAIIDEETHEKAVALVESRTAEYMESRRQNGEYKAAFGGLVYCGNCGARYFFYKRHRKSGLVHSYYVCYSRHKGNRKMIKDPTCKNPTFSEKELDEAVFAEIKKLALEPNKIQPTKSESADSENEKKIALLSEEIEKLDSQRLRFMDLYGIGQFSIEEIQERIQPLSEQKKKLTAEIDRIKKSASSAYQEDAVALIESFEDIIETGSPAEIRFVVEKLVDKIVVEPTGDLTIYWKFT